MKLAVLGATGRSGRPLVTQALAAGHDVVALVRDPAKLGLSHPQLQVYAGEFRDPAFLSQALAGVDAVISVIGHVKGSAPTMQTEITKALIGVLEAQGPRRLISLTGAGVAWSGDQPRFADRAIVTVMRLVTPAVLSDALAHAELLKASQLDWTIVRGPRLLEDAALGTYRVGMVGNGVGMQITRADLATFLLDLAVKGDYIRQAPVVSN